MFDFLKSRPKYYVKPEVDYFTLYDDMAKQAHLLIAGQTGSGKSVTINGIIYTLLRHTPQTVQLILIDPKKTELLDYSRLPHTIQYAATNSEIISALTAARDIMQSRFSEMARKHERIYTGGSDVYVIIDELAQLTLTLKKQTVPLLQEILQLGRAARVHIIAASQNPIIQVIPTVLKVNFTGIVALKTLTKQHSRNILGIPGCEEFPSPRIAGKALGYYLDGCEIKLYQMPMQSSDSIRKLCEYWSDEKNYLKY